MIFLWGLPAGHRPRSPLESHRGRNTSQPQVVENCWLCKVNENKALCAEPPHLNKGLDTSADSLRKLQEREQLTYSSENKSSHSAEALLLPYLFETRVSDGCLGLYIHEY